MNPQDEQCLGDLRAQLDTVEPGVDVLPALVGALREALHAERVLAYGVDIGPERYQVSYLQVAGFPITSEEAYKYLDGLVSTPRDPWGFYNPACPQPSQRNRVLQLQAPGSDAEPLTRLEDEQLAHWKTLGIPLEELARMQAQMRSTLSDFLQECGLERMMFLRVLVCEGPALLGWVGAVRPEPFEARELHMLQELTPSLRRRMWLDTHLREARMLNEALDAALEELGQPAFVVTSTGRMVHANNAGRAWLEQTRELLADALRAHLRGEFPGKKFSFKKLSLAGAPAHYLVTVQVEPMPLRARLHARSQDWGLTARETEVLGRLVLGESNRLIALRLTCAERTVEVHVTRILAKAQVESRSALIAKFFLTP